MTEPMSEESLKALKVAVQRSLRAREQVLLAEKKALHEAVREMLLESRTGYRRCNACGYQWSAPSSTVSEPMERHAPNCLAAPLED